VWWVWTRKECWAGKNRAEEMRAENLEVDLHGELVFYVVIIN
jgi:hypothetical protein